MKHHTETVNLIVPVKLKYETKDARKRLVLYTKQQLRSIKSFTYDGAQAHTGSIRVITPNPEP